LVIPSPEHVPGYIDALQRRWSPDTTRPAAAAEELQRIEADPEHFLREMDDREARGSAITLVNGTTVPRLPGFRRWMWDGEFCGSIGLRWQPGTTELPAHCLGHIGYTVVPWKRNRGHATDALRQMLPLARAEGLSSVDIVAEPDNLVSQRVIQTNGGMLVEEFTKTEANGGGTALLYRIRLS